MALVLGKAIGFLLILLLCPVPLAARAYQVLKVVDGDTFEATDGTIKFRVRIAGIDTPEKGEPYSKSATVELGNRIANKAVEVRPVGRGLDRYNRVLAEVLVDGKDVGVTLIELGLAAYYRPGCVDFPENEKEYDYDPRPYVAAEKKARAEKLRLWSVPRATLPCETRNQGGNGGRSSGHRRNGFLSRSIVLQKQM